VLGGGSGCVGKVVLHLVGWPRRGVAAPMGARLSLRDTAPVLVYCLNPTVLYIHSLLLKFPLLYLNKLYLFD
jgi:hypothetical protein